MAILPILEAPHPALSAKARRVEPHEFGPALESVLADLTATMYAAPGVGLAAPQVGDGRRMLVADVAAYDEAGERTERHERVQMVNPEIVERGPGKILWEESCLSLPEFYVDVERPRKVKVRWQDGGGGVQERWFEGFPAVVVQHEMDHLDGVTLLDRASRLKRGRWLQKQRKYRESAEAGAL